MHWTTSWFLFQAWSVERRCLVVHSHNGVVIFDMNVQTDNCWVFIIDLSLKKLRKSFHCWNVWRILKVTNFILVLLSRYNLYRKPIKSFADVLEKVVDTSSSLVAQLYAQMTLNHFWNPRTVRNSPSIVNCSSCCGSPGLSIGPRRCLATTIRCPPSIRNMQLCVVMSCIISGVFWISLRSNTIVHRYCRWIERTT